MKKVILIIAVLACAIPLMAQTVIPEPSTVKGLLSNVEKETEVSAQGHFRYMGDFVWGGDYLAAQQQPVKRIGLTSKGIELDGLDRDEAIYLLEDALVGLYQERLEDWEKQRLHDELMEAEAPPIILEDAGSKKYALQQKARGSMPFCNGCLVLGQTNCVEHRITIDHDDSDKRATVMHEVMHMALGCYGQDRMETEHDFIRDLAPRLVMILQRNPALVSFLVGNKPEPEVVNVSTMIQEQQLSEFQANE
jgi:hypothetical protein